MSRAEASQDNAIYPSCYRPKAPGDLIRIGSAFDGGYVISRRMLEATSGLLSFGLSDEWEFEAAFSEQAGVPVVCFDPTVDGKFWAKKFVAGVGKGVFGLDGKRLRRGFRVLDYARFFSGTQRCHIRKAIGYPGPNSMSLSEALAEAALPRPIFLKMDIEGWEYRILPQLVALRGEFVGLAIEFHDIDLHEARITSFIGEISDQFALIHFHANSHTTVGPQGIALVAELTFMARALLAPDEPLVEYELPIAGLDAPNIPGDKEVAVRFASQR